MTRHADAGSVGAVSTSETPLVRVLDETGKVAPTPAAEQYLPLIEAIPDDELAQFYRDMVGIRAIDTQATNLQRQGQLALWPPSRGQEAAQVGSGRAARAQDTIFPSYREHAVTRIRGVDPVIFEAGIDLHAKPGDRVSAGQPLFTLSAADEARFPRAIEALEGAWELGDDAPTLGPIVRERITA